MSLISSSQPFSTSSTVLTGLAILGIFAALVHDAVTDHFLAAELIERVVAWLA